MADISGNDAQAALVSKLKTACDEAYVHHPSSCSHAVWYVRRKMVDPASEWLDANNLLAYLKDSAHWKNVTADEGWALAQAGVMVIGGKKETDNNGHVIVVYPGAKKVSGGYRYKTHIDPKTGAVVPDILRSHGSYPRALSTSIGHWPGAMSDGDKTIWDPWANDAKFGLVLFYTPA